ncbi:hypothetical protein FA743_10960 [Paracoccus gahaiensis]|uniref:Uncharacterized protein n=1 Tax=Paracoccus gahaiensis TaxID=1706839 RepID=A0A4V5MWD9_9RHOB|nr:hypothetical protein [Paracoccus gahaiensis]TJZ91608.1 hypothetical protein FA743_10960 [Paracoccus gahaiensis]
MKTPAFPYHLTDDERKAVMNHAAHMFADEAMAATAASTGKSITEVRPQMADEAFMRGMTLVSLNWANERLKKLEDEVRAGRDRIAQLEAR